jgi:hypothetical protein
MREVLPVPKNIFLEEKTMAINAERVAAFVMLFTSGLLILIIHGKISRRFAFSPGGFAFLAIVALVTAAGTAFFCCRAACSVAEDCFWGPFLAKPLISACILPVSVVPAYFSVIVACSIRRLRATSAERARIAAMRGEHHNLQSLADSLVTHEKSLTAEIDARMSRIPLQRSEITNLEAEAKARLLADQARLAPLREEIARLVLTDGVSGIMRTQGVETVRESLRRVSRESLEEKIRALEASALDDEARLALLVHREALLLVQGNHVDLETRRVDMDRLVRLEEEASRRLDSERGHTSAVRADIERRAADLLIHLSQQLTALRERRINL